MKARKDQPLLLSGPPKAMAVCPVVLDTTWWPSSHKKPESLFFAQSGWSVAKFRDLVPSKGVSQVVKLCRLLLRAGMHFSLPERLQAGTRRSPKERSSSHSGSSVTLFPFLSPAALGGGMQLGCPLRKPAPLLWWGFLLAWPSVDPKTPNSRGGFLVSRGALSLGRFYFQTPWRTW